MTAIGSLAGCMLIERIRERGNMMGRGWGAHTRPVGSQSYHDGQTRSDEWFSSQTLTIGDPCIFDAFEVALPLLSDSLVLPLLIVIVVAVVIAFAGDSVVVVEGRQ